MQSLSIIKTDNKSKFQSLGVIKVLLFVLVASFFGGYFQDYVSIFSDGISLSIFMVVTGYYAVQRKGFSLDLKVFAILWVILFVFFFVSINNFYLFKSYLFLFTIIVLYLLLKEVDITIHEYLTVHNTAYLIYLILSALLYVGIIGSAKEINAFPAVFWGIEFTTFYGFHGSTASIDSYSIITALLNIVYNRNKFGIFIFSLSLFVAAGTMRTTPLLAIVGSMFLVGLIKVLGKRSIYFFNIILFLSFSVPLLVALLFENDAIDLFLNYATTGRAFLWSNYIQEYLNQDYLNLIIGTGNTTGIEVTAWKPGISNPHNSYFTFLISFGIILYTTLYWITSRQLIKCNFKEIFLVYSVFMICISNGVIFSFLGSHFIVLVMILLIQSDKLFYCNKYIIQRIRISSALESYKK